MCPRPARMSDRQGRSVEARTSLRWGRGRNDRRFHRSDMRQNHACQPDGSSPPPGGTHPCAPGPSSRHNTTSATAHRSARTYLSGPVPSARVGARRPTSEPIRPCVRLGNLAPNVDLARIRNIIFERAETPHARGDPVPRSPGRCHESSGVLLRPGPHLPGSFISLTII